MPLYDARKYPERFIELKKSIIGEETKVTQAWADLLAALKDATAEYASKGPSMIPIVEFDQLETLGMFAFSQGLQMRGFAQASEAVEDIMSLRSCRHSHGICLTN